MSEEDMKRPEEDIKHPEDNIIIPEDDGTHPEEGIVNTEKDIVNPEEDVMHPTGEVVYSEEGILYHEEIRYPEEDEKSGEAELTEEELAKERSMNFKVRPLCKPDVHLKKSRQRIFNENSFSLLYSFGYQSSYGSNLCVLKKNIVILVAGNYLNILNIDTLTETLMPSIYGAGFISVSVHPSTYYFAAAEKGRKFCINIFTYPPLEVCKTLKEECQIMPSCMMKFHSDGELLVSVSSDPENRVYIWQWEFEVIVFMSDDASQPISSLNVSTEGGDVFITSGIKRVIFWGVDSIRDERDNIAELVVTQHDVEFKEYPKLVACCTVAISDTEVLLELHTHVPIPVRCHMWFQQGEALSHYGSYVLDHLDWTFPKRWIRCSGLIAWPPRSPDLSLLDFFLGSHEEPCVRHALHF